MKKKLLNRREAAEFAGVSKQTITNWVASGFLRASSYNGHLLIDSSTLEQLYDSITQVENMRKAIDEKEKVLRKKKERLDKELEGMMTRIFPNVFQRTTVTQYLISLVERLANDSLLCDRERVILTKALDGDSPTAISEEFGLTRERIRQIVFKAIRKIASKDSFERYRDEALSLRDEVTKMKAVIAMQNEKIAEYENELEIKRDYECGEMTKEELDLARLLDLRAVDCRLSVRCLNCLHYADGRNGSGRFPNYHPEWRTERLWEIAKIGRTDLLKCRNFGRRTIMELDVLFDSYGIKWKDYSPLMRKYYKCKMRENGQEQGRSDS
jgi:hypothetical protein